MISPIPLLLTLIAILPLTLIPVLLLNLILVLLLLLILVAIRILRSGMDSSDCAATHGESQNPQQTSSNLLHKLFLHSSKASLNVGINLTITMPLLRFLEIFN